MSNLWVTIMLQVKATLCHSKDGFLSSPRVFDSYANAVHVHAQYSGT